MNILINIRNILTDLYDRYGMLLKPLLKTAAAFVMLLAVQNTVGFNTTLSKLPVIGCTSIICAFFPSGFITFVCAVFVIVNLLKLSVVMAGVAAVICILIAVLYFGYKPGTGIIISLVPLMFYLKTPFVLPVVLGISIGFGAAVPIAIGVFCWNMLHFFVQNTEILSEGGILDVNMDIAELVRGIVLDEHMLLLIVAFSVCTAASAMISRTRLNNCWIAAAVCGTGILFVFIPAGDIILGTGTLGADTAGLIVSLVLSVLYAAVVYSVDFRRTENLSFEDDDYYYYVKAVPKLKPRE
ncbi:MAG: hypothetical protein Q4D40_02880 [Eubacteriales bacterium]|nr:hypothetical protein [Eubacteriales bacterium]